MSARGEKRIRCCSVAVLLLLAAPGAAVAQTFPSGDAWAALPCRGGVMTDLYQDESGALGPRDIVGVEETPAGFRAVDSEFLYLRLRLDEDPTSNGSLRPFGWGFEIDTDEVLSTYEILILANGVASTVVVHSNTTTTIPDDPTDPADEPPVASYTFATHGRSIAATDSSFGGAGDFFLDVAVPWTDLQPLGLDPDTPISVWAASSSNVNSLNGDFACHDGTTGDPSLTGTVSDPTVLDPDIDTDGDGYPDGVELAAGTDPFDPNDFPADTGFEGGGGCSAGGQGGAAIVLLGLLLAVVAGRSRARVAGARRLRRR